MQLTWMNGGRPFVPKTTMGDAEDTMELEDRAKRGELTPYEKYREQIDFITRVLQRTDPSVTRESVRDNITLVESTRLSMSLLAEPIAESVRLVNAAASGGQRLPPVPTEA